MIQSANSNVRKVEADRNRIESEAAEVVRRSEARLNTCFETRESTGSDNKEFKNRYQTWIILVRQIDRVFAAARRQKAWDQFTKAQRKNISQWIEHLQVTKYFKCSSKYVKD